MIFGRSKGAKPCPIDPEGAQLIANQLEKIDDRLQKIEQMMFAGRVALSVIIGITLMLAWIFENTGALKNAIQSWFNK